MLPIQSIREDANRLVEALSKRGLNAQPMIDEILSLDENRRNIQLQLDTTLAESNRISKEIGMLFKSGKREEADALKDETVRLKETSKSLSESLSQAAEALQQALYAIPMGCYPSIAYRGASSLGFSPEI